MGLIRRIADRFGRAPETRAVEPSWAALRGWQSAAGQRVDPNTAEALATCYAAVQAIASAIAALPALIYRRDGPDRVEAPEHPLQQMVRMGPNRHLSWPDLIEFILASCLLRGNGLIEITTTGELVPHPWERVSVVLLPSNRLAFDVSDVTRIFSGVGRQRRLLDTECLHLKDRTDDGLVGRSRLSRAAAAIGASIATQDFASQLYVNGAFPSGVLEVPNPIGE